MRERNSFKFSCAFTGVNIFAKPRAGKDFGYSSKVPKKKKNRVQPLDALFKADLTSLLSRVGFRFR